MRIYEDRNAPNPRRVRVFLAEKGIDDVEFVQVQLARLEHRTPEHLARNPLSWVPVLELDDGRTLGETVAICRYFEYLRPEPRLMGGDGEDQAFVEMWDRRMEFEIFWPIAMVFRHTHEFFKGKIPQVAEYGQVQREYAATRMAWLNDELADREFIAGERYSIADITALCGIDFGRVTGQRIAPEHSHLQRWYDRVSTRPSASA